MEKRTLKDLAKLDKAVHAAWLHSFKNEDCDKAHAKWLRLRAERRELREELGWVANGY